MIQYFFNFLVCRNRITFIDIDINISLKLEILLAEDEKDIITTFKMALEVGSHRVIVQTMVKSVWNFIMINYKIFDI
jgi:hypothetical protein